MESKVRAGIFIGVIAILAVVLTVSLLLGNRGGADSFSLRIGVDEGMIGFLMGDVAIAAEEAGLSIDLNVFVDCCGNAAQWAINSGRLDIGFFCPDIAGVLTGLNRDLEIYGPAVLNAEVVALRGGVDAPTIVAIPAQRNFLIDLVHENFPSVTEIIQSAPNSILFALSSGGAEGAVMDLSGALQSKDFEFRPLSGEEFVSYSLVVHKDLIDTPQFARFVETFNLITDDYNDPEFLESRFGLSGSIRDITRIRFEHLSEVEG